MSFFYWIHQYYSHLPIFVYKYPTKSRIHVHPFLKVFPLLFGHGKTRKNMQKKHIHYFHSQRFGVKNHRPQPFGVKRFKRRNAKTASKSSRLKGCFFPWKLRRWKKKHIFEIVPPEKKNRCFSTPPQQPPSPWKKTPSSMSLKSKSAGSLSKETEKSILNQQKHVHPRS